MESFDVVVIGAGVSGLYLSKLLENSKTSYVTLEKRSAIGTYGPRIISLETLKKLEMPKEKLIHPIHKINFCSSDETTLKIDDKNNRGYVVNLKDIEEHLFERINNKKQIKFNENVVDFDLNSRILKLLNGKEIKFKKLVLATGILGVKFRNKLGITHPRNVFCYSIEIKAKDDITTIIDNELANGFYGWVIPLEDGKIEIGYGSEELNIRDKKEIDGRLKSLAHLRKYKFKKALRVNGGFIPTGTINKRCNHEWIIIGDASGGEPMLGGSIHKCIDEARLCHDALIQNLNGETISMKNYEIEWEKLFYKDLVSQTKIRQILDETDNNKINQVFKELQGEKIAGDGLINDLFRNVIMNLKEWYFDKRYNKFNNPPLHRTDPFYHFVK